jgi:hypothetical protein
MTDAEIIDAVIEREVGPATWADLLSGKIRNAVHRDPADRGGTTNMGITCVGLTPYLGRPATDADVAALTLPGARTFYVWLLKRTGMDDSSGADSAIRALAFDIMVNHGADNGVRMLQRALGMKVDGRLGAERLEFTGRCISRNLRDDDHDGVPDMTEQAAGLLARQAQFWRDTP